MDVFASFINLIAVRVSDRPPDKCHRYGHGKAEGMAGFFQSILIGASAGLLAYESCYRIFRPMEVARPLLGVAVIDDIGACAPSLSGTGVGYSPACAPAANAARPAVSAIFLNDMIMVSSSGF